MCQDEDQNQEHRRIAAIRTLRKVKSFQHRNSRYEELLDDKSELIRLEVLSHALEDIVGISEQNIRSVLSRGTALERRYALLILARNGLVDCDFVEQTDIGQDEHAVIWKQACLYAIEQTFTNALALFRYVDQSDLASASLAINLTVTIANAVHRVLIFDLIKVLLKSGVVPERLSLSLRQALPGLAVRASWKSIQEYRFKRSEVWRLLS